MLVKQIFIPINSYFNFLYLAPGDFFVHRNVGNLINPSDTSLNSVLQFSIEGLKVKHIILCGHYDCGAIKASFKGSSGMKHVDEWIKPIVEIKIGKSALF